MPTGLTRHNLPMPVGLGSQSTVNSKISTVYNYDPYYFIPRRSQGLTPRNKDQILQRAALWAVNWQGFTSATNDNI